MAASDATGFNTSPAAVFGNGCHLVFNLVNKMSVASPLTSLMLGLAAVVAVISIAIIALIQIEAIIEANLVIGAGAILLGFFGTKYTSEFAKGYIAYVFNTGVKLMVAGVVVGTEMSIFQDMSDKVNADSAASVLEFMGVTIILASLSRTVPGAAMALVRGFGGADGRALKGAVRSAVAEAVGAATAVGTAAVAAGVPDAVKGAVSAGATSPVGRALASTGKAVRNAVQNTPVGSAARVAGGAAATAMRTAAATPGGKVATAAARAGGHLAAGAAEAAASSVGSIAEGSVGAKVAGQIRSRVAGGGAEVRSPGKKGW